MPLDFSLLYFANREATDPPSEYELLRRSAQFADDNGFTALWVPERHFHPFGGAFPNPALAAAALAAVTNRIRLRAGSVVLPLHDPLTVVEDWSFVDNLSGGRVDIACATGWNPNDFVLAPDGFADRRERTLDGAETLRDLWAGKKVTRRNGAGAQAEVMTYPRPVQPELRLWLTCASNPQNFADAGARGMNVLTALLFQRVEDLEPRIRAYREARASAGLDPATGVVTVMLHTFVGESDDAVRAIIREPFLRYLESSIDLWRTKWADLGAGPRDKLVAFAFERYFRTSALFGSWDRCVTFARDLRAAGVDEIACLIDFGVADETILGALPWLTKVRDLAQD
ncbi:MupA/Atu3671 family FMN-dependent luciferase-like monooxygenase [Actinoplanes sp. NPDC020271]|uniref:MupA/Atu3671 family FMN-dependent luciferase-like monooxygenase n=1 Tax=Actinoplanes sp. NPDC020271 TaxID=3363896 RepID=UPI00379BD34A